MEPVKLTCPQCGAPFQPVPGATSHVCQFCKMSFAFNASSVEEDDEDWDDDDDEDDYDDDSYEEHHHHHYHQQGPSIAGEAGRSVARSLGPMLMVGGIIALTSLAGGGYALNNFILHPKGWDGKKPYECSGVEQVQFKNVKAEFQVGSAVIVNGNCHFECEDCQIKSPIPVSIGGNGQAVIVNGTVEGSDTIAEVGGNGKLDLRGNAKATGPKPRVKANGQVSGLPSAPSASAPAAQAAPQATAAAPAAAPKAAAPKATAKPAGSTRH